MNNSLIINQTLSKDIESYCKLNNIDDIDKFIIKCLRRGFDSEKFGLLNADEQPVKEIEVIKEIPVEKVVTKYKNDNKKIKELEEKIKKLEEKEVFSTDDKSKKLSETLQVLKKENSDKTTQINDLTNKIMELENLIETSGIIKIKKI
jgi:predicted  nucleic acid-binding Zn-ribbon protein